MDLLPIQSERMLAPMLEAEGVAEFGPAPLALDTCRPRTVAQQPDPLRPRRFVVRCLAMRNLRMWLLVIPVALSACPSQGTPHDDAGTGGSSSSTGTSGASAPTDASTDAPTAASTDSSPGTGSSEAGSTGEVDPPAWQCIFAGDTWTGAVEWTRKLDISLGGLTLATTPANEVILAGGRAEPGSFTGFVALWDAAGAQRWEVLHAGPMGLSANIIAVSADTNGDVYALAQETVRTVQYEENVYSDRRLSVLRIGPDGEILWRWLHESPLGVPEVYTPDGDIRVVDGNIRVLETALGLPHYTEVITLDHAGDVVDEIPLAIPSEVSVQKAVLGPDGAAHVGGSLNAPFRLWVGHASLDGSLIWADEITEEYRFLDLLLPGAEGDTYVLWSTDDPDRRFSLRRYMPDGTADWTHTLPMQQFVLDGTLACDGGVLLAGGLRKPNPQQLVALDFWLGRVAPDGAAGWEYLMGPSASSTEARDIALAPDGDLVVRGINEADLDHSYLQRFDAL